MVGWLRVLPVEIPDEAFTNQTVIELHQSGLPEDILLAIVESANGAQFSTSLGDLLTLRSAGVSDRVIRSIRARKQHPSTSTSTSTSTSAASLPLPPPTNGGTPAPAGSGNHRPTIVRCTGGPIKVGFSSDTSVAVSLDASGKLLLYAGMSQNPNLVLLIHIED